VSKANPNVDVPAHRHVGVRLRLTPTYGVLKKDAQARAQRTGTDVLCAMPPCGEAWRLGIKLAQ